MTQNSQNPASFHEANIGSVNSEVMTAVKTRKSNFEGTLFRHNDVWEILRAAWILPPNANETDEEVRLFPGFVVARNGREETFFLSTLIRPITDYDGNEIAPEGSANVKARELFDRASSDEEAIANIARDIKRIKVVRTKKYNAYLRSTGKSRPNTLLLEFDLA